MTNPRFVIEGPPYPHDLPFYETEALDWFTFNKEKALPWQTNFESVMLVKRFYEAGAARVNVIVENADCPVQMIRQLDVFLPVGDFVKRKNLIVMARIECQLEAQPHMEKKDIAAEVHREEAELAGSNSPGPVPVWWEIT